MVCRFGRVGFAALAVWLTVGIAVMAPAQDRRQNEPGQFDFYVLALSWSPSFCEASGERGTPPQQQCGARPYSFVVHGLWPQYENGFPEFCQQPAPRLNRNIVSSMLDLMPAPRLIFHEWDRHLFGAFAHRLFRNRAQSARGGEDTGGLHRTERAAHGHA
jgi:ribonuclease T2